MQSTRIPNISSAKTNNTTIALARATSALAIVALLCPSLAGFTKAEIVGRYQLPDKRFVDKECGSLTQRTRKSSRLHTSVEQACADFRAGRATEDSWIAAINDAEKVISLSAEVFELVPRTYNTYAMFLIPSHEWKSRSKDLKELHETFLDFGDAIGEMNLAIWFPDGLYRPATLKRSEKLLGTFDIQRNRDYCDRFHLDYNNGPFIVVTRTRPDLVRDGDEIVVIQLHDIDIPKVTRVLNSLEQDLRNGQEIRKRTLVYEEVKERIQTFVEHNGKTLGTLFVNILGKKD